MSSVSEEAVDGETEPEPSGGIRCRKAALGVAAVIVTAGAAIAVCTMKRRPDRRDAGTLVTQIGLVNVVSRPKVYRPVLRAGSRRRRAGRRGAGGPETTGARSRRPTSRLGGR